MSALTFGETVVDVVETLISWVSGQAHQNMEDYCDLETADSRQTLVMRDGSLLSVIKMPGARYLVGDEEFNRIHDRLSSTLTSYMNGGGHAMQVYFEKDPDGIRREIDRLMAPSVETAKRLGLQVMDVIDDEKRAMSRYCAFEQCFVVLYTRPTALNKDALKRVKATQDEAYRKMTAPARDAGNPVVAVGEIRDRHSSFVNAFMNDMRDVGLILQPLDVHAAVHAIRMTVDPDFTDDNWRASLPGDKIPARIPKERAGRDISNLLWPAIPQQLFPRDAEIKDKFLTIGDRIYASVHTHLSQMERQPFQALFHRTAEYKLPWRVSFLIESEGLKGQGLKSLVASILAFTHNDNSLVADSLNELREQVKKLGVADVKFRTAFSTWAPSDNIKLLKTRISQLARAVEGWGQCEVREHSGDPAASFVSSGLALNLGSVATAAAAPLSEAAYQLPFARPSSQWNSGSVLFRTPDGKVWPYQPGSSLQDTWIGLIFAGPGSGKSVLLNKLNFGLCLSPGIERLPRILIVDIGPSSSGFISLLKEALPEGQKHQAMYSRLRMTPEFAINPCDTQLGSRYPTPLERTFLKNFMVQLTTPVGKEPYNDLPDLISLVVNEVYEMYSDQRSPRPYTKNWDAEVDAAIDEYRIPVDNRTTWWEVVDAIFEHGDIRRASLAQRYAVPTIPDMVAAAHTESIRKLYENNKTSTGEPLVEAFSRLVSGAVRDFSILSTPTKFDLGEARVVSLDLDEVAKSGGDSAHHQSAIMYMLARHTARDFYLNESNLGDMPEKYKAYHKKRIQEIREDVKCISMDEFHRTAHSPAVREQVIVDMREGRKWGVHINLLSQSIDDFDENMVEFASAIYILSAGPRQTVENLSKVFGLTPTAKFALERRVHGPRKGGNTFLAQFRTKTGTDTQLLTNTAGDIEMWAFSTTVDDVLIRNKLYQILGPQEARRILAVKYPGGSAAEDVERRRLSLKDSGALEDAQDLGVIDTIVQEVYEFAKQYNLEAA